MSAYTDEEYKQQIVSSLGDTDEGLVGARVAHLWNEYTDLAATPHKRFIVVKLRALDFYEGELLRLLRTQQKLSEEQKAAIEMKIQLLRMMRRSLQDDLKEENLAGGSAIGFLTQMQRRDAVSGGSERRRDEEKWWPRYDTRFDDVDA